MSLRLPWLDPARPDWFPPTAQALTEPNGLLCAGGDLSTERLRHAYVRGIFPWFSPGEPILWWTPDPRCVLPLAHLHLPRSLRRFLRNCDWHITADTEFEAVVQACAAPRAKQSGTWISTPMRRAYLALHQQGIAHSIEVRARDGSLIGGLYGLALGRVFFGESMFSRQSQASKVALFALATGLRELGYVVLDGQVESPHLRTLGFECWPRQRFEAVLPGDPCASGAWRSDWSLQTRG